MAALVVGAGALLLVDATTPFCVTTVTPVSYSSAFGVDGVRDFDCD